ncbi:MAG TPA: GNAT family N-acetyltransferase [Kofleriaceae bacterium]
MLALDDEIADRVHRLGVEILELLGRAAMSVQPGTTGARIGTGYALFCGEGSPLTQIYGFAHRGADDPENIAAFYKPRCQTWEISITPFTDPQTLHALLDRGYRPGPFEGELAQWVGLVPEPELRVEEVDGHDRAWLETTALAWSEDKPEELDPLIHVIAEAPTRKYVAFVDGTPAGTAIMWDRNEGVVLASGATRPAFRKRGVQRAMLQRRLRDAGEGRFAIVGAMPGTSSYRNVVRAGFTPLYSTLCLKPA